jgi:hypothetical protein
MAGGGEPPRVSRVLNTCLWDNVRVKLTHPLFNCMMYVVEFFPYSLNSYLLLVDELFIHLDVFTNQTARLDSLYLEYGL